MLFNKLGWLTLICWLLLIISILLLLPYGIQKWIVLPSFLKLEQEFAQKDLIRVIDAIKREVHHLEAITTTFASWDETYEFITTSNDRYIKTSFSVGSFISADIHMYHIYNNEGVLLKGEIYDTEYKKKIKVEQFSAPKLENNNIYLLKHKNFSLLGIINTQAGLMAINARPILTSQGEGPVMGTVVMGRFLTKKFFNSLSKQTKVEFSVIPLNRSTLALQNFNDALYILNDKTAIKAINTDFIEMYGIIDDIYNEPVLLTHLRIPRDIMVHGKHAAKLTSISIISSLFVISASLFLFFIKYSMDIRQNNKLIKIKVAQRTEELVQAKDEAIKANRAKGDFLANMSHELRTPMNAILGMAELCQQTELTMKQQKFVGNIHYSAKSLLHLFNSILDFSKIDAGKVELEFVDFTLDDILCPLEVLTNEQVRAKDIPLIFDIKLNLSYMIIGDKLRLRQIMLNFIQNSLKFTESGSIYLKVRLVDEVDDWVWFEFLIQDTGIGMDPETIAHIFDEFSQADTSTTRKYGGTGLGLSICKQLIELMGGEVSLDSELGKGTQVKIRMPFQLSSQENVGFFEALVGHKILIYSEDQAYAHALLNTLSRYGSRVTLVDSAEKALSFASTHDTCLIDDALPEFDIINFLTSLNLQAKLLDTILLTNNTEPKEVYTIFNLSLLTKAVYLNNFIQASKLLSTEIKSFKLSHDKLDKLFHSLHDKNILLVEDNDINQQVIIELLAGIGIATICAENGEVALSLLENSQFDAILMDIQMPVMDGIETTKVIRSNMLWQDIPIIALTASAMVGDKEKSLAIGMNDYLTKPIFPEQLYDCLERWCSHSKVNTSTKEPVNPINDKVINEGHENNDNEIQIQKDDVLDITAGLKVCAGKRHLLESMWKRFVEKHSDSGKKLQAYLSSHEYEKALALLHNLKGVSGNIGALQLYTEVTQLHTLLAQDETQLNEHDIKKVIIGLSKVCDCINKQINI
ncbi:ATP-binding protein [Pseudoalteromonas denitrificans]|uniref:histidine kinase n=1 Tax=Pseudoalteromonas denitrificans DSM 6059 TaxID=1123010 RepID=A0A1I1I885_9GAMM|nr:ATP-binding protein [Pseudoalteromonas denitrificans]SFC32386.1 Signal transduction histidine kinase [Pseudoalteromonas denitrificans DSM 6059]